MHRRPKLSLRESQQKYKDLYGNPGKSPEKKLSIKKPDLIAIVRRFLPVCFFFPDSTRIEPLSVPRLSLMRVKLQG